MESSIYKYIWLSLPRVCNGPVPVFNILDMAPYLETRSNVLKMGLFIYISLPEKSDTNLGESTHTIGSKNLMHIMEKASSAVDGTMQSKAPTWYMWRMSFWE